MRNKTAKEVKRKVMFAMYMDKETSKEELQKERKSVFASSDFKSVYRARKKNYNKTEQIPNLDYSPKWPKVFPTVEDVLMRQKIRRHRLKMR